MSGTITQTVTVTSESFEIVERPSGPNFIQKIIEHILTYAAFPLSLITVPSSYVFNAAVSGISSLVRLFHSEDAAPQDIEAQVGNYLQSLQRAEIVNRLELTDYEFPNEAEKEEEHEKQMELAREQARARRAAMLANLSKENSEVNARRASEREEAAAQFEQTKMESQSSQLFKNQMAQLELDVLEAQRKEEQENMKKKMREDRERNREKLDMMNEKIAMDRVIFEKLESQQQQDHKEEEERFQQRMTEIQEHLERNLEKMRQRAEQRKLDMDYQLREIYRVLRNRIWNEIIEGNWTKRLNMLRAANRDVETVFRSMRAHSRSGQLSEVHKSNLLAALNIEIEMMSNESVEMHTMHVETGKSFLLDIKQAVDDVKAKCAQFSCALNANCTIDQFDKLYSDLSHASSSIPTLAELKYEYAESMK